ncbi:MAG: DUF4340 domain-containing protein [Sedimentisphaerales bacterium]|nr:DUF4340 domain-containing protein [Sedimentisphaerales bacterium]
MSNKKLIILGFVAAIMIILAVLQPRMSRKSTGEVEEAAYLIQGLDPADIGSIVIGSGDDEVVLKRKEGGFVVVNKDNYLAKSREINELITSCLDIRTSELYASDRSVHKDLGVTEEEAQSVVRFLKRDSSLLTGVVIGKAREMGRGTFVRRLTDDNVYVSFERTMIRDRAMSYIEQELLSLDREDIESVMVTAAGESYTLKRNEDGKMVLAEEFSEGRKLKSDEADKVAFALTNLRFTDVKSTASSEGGHSFIDSYVCRLKDSTVYTLQIAKKGDKTFIICDAEFTDKTPVTKEGGVESEEELKKKEAKLLARDAAEVFSAKCKGWIYEIPDSRAKELIKGLSELVEEPEEAAEETEAEPADTTEAEL